MNYGLIMARSGIPALDQTIPRRMWTPADASALPSEKDLINARSAIDETKTELEIALKVLEAAKLRVAALIKSLEVQRAWIAPIRRLNFDTLSRVFEFSGEDDPKTVMRISAVSHQWRATVLSTPRAWSFLSISHCDDHNVIKLFFD
ncbi:hypothetical protein M408DRAFT_30336, partial [Serendipita vermifera MAFF 305830]